MGIHSAAPVLPHVLGNGQKQYAERDKNDLIAEAAVLVLQLIGVTASPPPPGADLADLGNYPFGDAWTGGVVSKPTFRGLAGMMIKELPPETKKQIAQFLLRSAEIPLGDTAAEYDLISDLTYARDPTLDAQPIAPVIGINVRAPQRAIHSAIDLLVREWKQQLQIPETRRREDRLPEYLRVWDMREGWIGERYDIAVEQQLEDIARELSLSVKTVTNRYRSAFRYVSGHDYCRGDWLTLFGVLKLSAVADKAGLPSISKRRPRKSPTRRPVPDSVVTPKLREEEEGEGEGEETLTVVESLSTVTETREWLDFVSDVDELRARTLPRHLAGDARAGRLPFRRSGRSTKNARRADARRRRFPDRKTGRVHAFPTAANARQAPPPQAIRYDVARTSLVMEELAVIIARII